MLLQFFLAESSFEETLPILPTMGIVLLGMTFFEIYLVTIDVKNHLVHLPDISTQVHRKSGSKYPNSLLELQTTQKMVIPPFQQVILPVLGEATYAPTNGALETTPTFERRDAFLVSSALVSMTQGKTMPQNTNPHNHTNTLNSCAALDNFKVMTMQ